MCSVRPSPHRAGRVASRTEVSARTSPVLTGSGGAIPASASWTARGSSAFSSAGDPGIGRVEAAGQPRRRRPARRPDSRGSPRGLVPGAPACVSRSPASMPGRPDAGHPVMSIEEVRQLGEPCPSRVGRDDVGAHLQLVIGVLGRERRSARGGRPSSQTTAARVELCSCEVPVEVPRRVTQCCALGGVALPRRDRCRGRDRPLGEPRDRSRHCCTERDRNDSDEQRCPPTHRHLHRGGPGAEAATRLTEPVETTTSTSPPARSLTVTTAVPAAPVITASPAEG